MKGINIFYDNNKHISLSEENASFLAEYMYKSDSFNDTDTFLNEISLEFDPEVLSLILGNNSEPIIEFGSYPQAQASDEINSKLESIYEKLTSVSPEKIYPMEENYTIMLNIIRRVPILTNTEYNHDYCQTIKKKYKVYEYGGEKYIRVDKNNWMKVEPLKWKVDKENNRLVSTKSFVNGLLEQYLYDASMWADGLFNIVCTRFSKDKTDKYLNKYVLKDILQNINLQKVIKYHSFDELIKDIKEHKNYESFQDLVEINFEGPYLDGREKDTIRSYLGYHVKVKYTIVPEKQLNEEKKSPNYKFKQIESKKVEQSDKVKEKYKEVLQNIDRLRISILSLESEKGVSISMLKRLYSSISVPDDLLLTRVEDHYEFNPEFIPLLKYIDLSFVNAKNLKLSNLDLSETNLTFDPQEIYNKDLSNSILADHNIIFKSFKGVNLSGSNIERETESYDFEHAVIDSNTLLPSNKGKALI